MDEKIQNHYSSEDIIMPINNDDDGAENEYVFKLGLVENDRGKEKVGKLECVISSLRLVVLLLHLSLNSSIMKD